MIPKLGSLPTNASSLRQWFLQMHHPPWGLISMDSYHCKTAKICKNTAKHCKNHSLTPKRKDTVSYVLLCKSSESGKECCKEDWKELWMGSTCIWALGRWSSTDSSYYNSHSHFLSTCCVCDTKPMPLVIQICGRPIQPFTHSLIKQIFMEWLVCSWHS